ncbi:MAG: DMT family transporter [Gemmatimonadota bacterium]
MTGRLRGYIEVVAAAAMWGSSGIFAVYLFRFGVPPESLALLRPVVGAIILLGVVAIRAPSSLKLDRTGWLVLAGGGGVAIGVFQIAYQLSTDAVGVPSTVAMLYLAPAVVAIASGPLLNEWPDRTRIALLVITLTGVWLSVLGAEDVTPAFGSTGLMWGVLAGVSYGAYTLFGRYAAPLYGSMPTVVVSTLGSCVFLGVAVPLLSGPIVLPASGAAWGTLIAFGLLTIAVAHFLFFDALTYIDASRASIATAIEPVVAAILATWLLSQGLRPMGWIGIALVVIGVAGVGLTTRMSPDDAPPEVSEVGR